MDCTVEFQESIEFTKVKSGIASLCIGVPGKRCILALEPLPSFPILIERLQFQQEIWQLNHMGLSLPLQAYSELDDDIRKVSIEGYVLPAESFLLIRSLFLNLEKLHRFLNDDRRKQFPLLSEFITQIPFKSELADSINRIFDVNGEVKPDASPDFVRIRKSIQQKNQELEQEFRRLLQKFRQSNLLTESEETMRNGRRVFSVPVEYKRRISGIIHDESATGKTVYIEPDELIHINNEIFSLLIEERKEIYKILKVLSGQFRFELDYLDDLVSMLAGLDSYLSIQRYAGQYSGVIPKVIEKPFFKWNKAFHPLLYLKNAVNKAQTVPFDFDVHPPNRLVLLSGPNAGGKSVTMKAVGLIQVMVQSGIPVPVAEYSEFGFFKKFYADIGDKQSLEDDLSTYSSHLRNIQAILSTSDADTLVLIDEFGGGTDPKMGGAIAEAVLIHLNRSGSWGVITTHYSNLKLLAFKEKGIVNAAMQFDKESLRPTYQFNLGKPGSSYAFEIARKSGLPDKLIQYAKSRSIEKESQVDEMLIDIQTDKQHLEKRISELKEKERSMNAMMANLEQARRDLEIRRKKWKLEVRENQSQTNEKEIRRLEELLKEIRKSGDKQSLERLISQKKEKRKSIGDEVFRIQEEVYSQKLELSKEPIIPGVHVKMLRGDTTGIVTALQGKNAIVEIGEIRAKIALKDLETIKAPLDSNQKKAIYIDTIGKSTQFVPKIDIRGFTKDEALRTLDEFLDKAALSSAHQLEVLHGKGNGVLRNIVKSKLKEYNFVLAIRHPEQEHGGDGITIADLSL
jgi:DNA mismatch repair protein MutS2